MWGNISAANILSGLAVALVITYLLPLLNIAGSDAWVFKQVGYSVADILAKAVYGLIIFYVARRKSFEDDAAFAAIEESKDEAPALR